MNLPPIPGSTPDPLIACDRAPEVQDLGVGNRESLMDIDMEAQQLPLPATAGTSW
jgi:hypothetical protein